VNPKFPEISINLTWQCEVFGILKRNEMLNSTISSFGWEWKWEIKQSHV